MTVSRLYTLFRQCLRQRKHPREFGELLSCAVKRWASSNAEIAACLLKSALDFCPSNDPLIPLYLQAILDSRICNSSNILVSCVQRWQHDSEKPTSDSTHHARTLAQLMTDFTLIFSNQQTTVQEARTIIILGARWLLALFKLADDHSGKHRSEQNMVLIGAVSLFLITSMNTVAGNQSIRDVEHDRNDPMNIVVRQVIQGSMAISPDISMQLVAEAEKHHALLDSTDPASEAVQENDLAAFQFEAGIAQAPFFPSRAATYCLLYTKLMNASTIDDGALLNYLNTRHSGDHFAMFNDLLFASFDTLTKPAQSQQQLFRTQCCIYLHNKLPAVLSLIAPAGSLGSLSAEPCLQDLWNEVTAIANPEATTAAKHFLHVCVLHRLISPQAVHTLTGEDANSPVAQGLFGKQKLVDQVNDNPARGPRLVDQLVKNDGNAGPISQAILEICHRYCQAKETQHLKDMANTLVRQPTTINSIGLFIRPHQFLLPLCRLIDEWSWDIHGESQPIYEEFGSILLLVMTFKYRLGLRDSELGITSPNGFMAEYLAGGHSEKLFDQMTSAEKKQLGEWIENLYFSEGISDDVTTNCSAKEFYSLIPTLLRQSMTALSKGVLSREKLEGGLDYLLEPFLLPSLLPSFAWLANAAEKDVKNVTVIVRRLAKGPENADASKLHRTILEMAHGMFRNALWRVAEQPPFAEIFSLFSETAEFTVSTSVTNEQLLGWKSQDGGILSSLQKSISDLIAIQPAGLFQPSILCVSTNLRGPKAVLRSMITLLVQFAQSHDFNQLLDIISTIVASASPNTFALRNTLQLYHAELGNFLKKDDALFAQALVHLHRQTELYATALTPQPAAEASALMPVEGADLADLNLDQVPVSTDAAKPPPGQGQQQDQLVADNLDQMFDQAGDMGNMDDYTTNTDNFFQLDDYELQELDDLDMSGF